MSHQNSCPQQIYKKYKYLFDDATLFNENRSIKKNNEEQSRLTSMSYEDKPRRKLQTRANSPSDYLCDCYKESEPQGSC